MAYAGVVVSFRANKGYGFVGGCDQLAGDVFFGRVALPSELKEVAGRQVDLRGRNVLFDVNMQDQAMGKLVASSIRLVVSESEICTGYIRSYDSMAGLGWIESASLDTAVQFTARDLPPQQQGLEPPLDSLASFSLQVSPDGNFEARELQLIEANGVEGGEGKGKGKVRPGVPNPPPPASRGSQGLYGGCGLVVPSGAPPRQAQVGQRLQGTVVSYNHAKGWGFLRSPLVQGDCFFKGQDHEITEGMSLHFTLKIMPDGKAQAREIAMGLSNGQQCMATVTSWSHKNGWGFFTVPGAPSDIYFQRKVLPPEMQDHEDIKGAHAYITVLLTSDGKPQTFRAEFVDTPPPGYTPPTGASGGKRPAPGAPASQPKRMRALADGEGSTEPPIAATGTVLSYNPVKGFGFMQSLESTTGDVWFGKNSLTPELLGQELQGRQMSFQLTFTPDGKAQARECFLID